MNFVLFDLDNTVVDSAHLKPLRDQRRWAEVYQQIAALLHEYPLRVGRRGPRFSGPSAGATLRG